MRYLILSLLCLLSFDSTILAQSYNIGSTQLSFVDPARSNRQIDVEVFYPANSAGTDVAIANDQFPTLIFGHGFLMTYDAYDVIWQALVPEGYIMVLPTTEGSFAPSHEDFGKDLAFLRTAMQQEATDNTSIFYNSVDSNSAVMGHSMGGGSAFLAMQYDSNFTAIATLAAAETNPSAITAAGVIQKPALVLAGANDCVTPPNQHQDLMYTALSSSSKHQISITGASHCQFGSSNFFCSAGEATCSPSATISAAQQQGIAADLLIPFLDHFLKANCHAADQFQNYVDSATTITVNQSTTLSCTTTNLESIAQEKTIFKIYPNPSQGSAYFEISTFAPNTQLSIYNQLGQLIHQQIIQNKIEELPSLNSGIYQIILQTKNGEGLGQQTWLVVD